MPKVNVRCSPSLHRSVRAEVRRLAASGTSLRLPDGSKADHADGRVTSGQLLAAALQHLVAIGDAETVRTLRAAAGHIPVGEGVVNLQPRIDAIAADRLQRIRMAAIAYGAPVTTEGGIATAAFVRWLHDTPGAVPPWRIPGLASVGAAPVPVRVALRVSGTLHRLVSAELDEWAHLRAPLWHPDARGELRPVDQPSGVVTISRVVELALIHLASLDERQVIATYRAAADELLASPERVFQPTVHGEAIACLGGIQGLLQRRRKASRSARDVVVIALCRFLHDTGAQRLEDLQPTRRRPAAKPARELSAEDFDAALDAVDEAIARASAAIDRIGSTP